MKNEKYTGTSLEKALASKELDTPSFFLTGMVKSSKKSGQVSFTLSGCDSWVDIPCEMIESAEHLGIQGCANHSHPLMRITLKQSGTPEGNLLYSLLSQQQTNYSDRRDDPSRHQQVFKNDDFLDNANNMACIGGVMYCRNGYYGRWYECGSCEVSNGDRLRASRIASRRAVGKGPGSGDGRCWYYSCGTCSDGSVMFCSDTIGCPPSTCTDLQLPQWGNLFTR